MIKKTITYEDYDGNEYTEDFYFNLSKAEVMEMQLSTDGTFTKYIERIIAAKNVPEIVKVFKELITKSYGQKSLDGKRFIKSPELVEAFVQTEAYSNLYWELSTDAEKAVEFINNIIPKDMQVAAQDANFKLVGNVTE